MTTGTVILEVRVSLEKGTVNNESEEKFIRPNRGRSTCSPFAFGFTHYRRHK